MKSIKNIINTVAMMCMGVSALTSCTDGNDWDIDSAYDRLFGASDITITPSDVSAAIAFTTRSGATGYVIEINQDSTVLHSSDEVNSTSLVDTAATTPFTFSGLTGDTKYYMRMKSIADGETDSHWVYYSKSSNSYFKTDAEQIFNDLTSSDIDDSSINVSWNSTKTVTNLVVINNNDTIQNIILSDDEKTSGKYTITGLSPTTSYTICIFNGSTKRGTLTATTAAAMPSADYKYTMSASQTVLSQNLIDEIATAAQEKAGSTTNYSVTIGIPANATIEIYGTSEDGTTTTNVSIPDGMSVTFFGLAGGDAPTLKLTKNFDIAGSHAYIKFQNVNCVDNGAKYFINQSTAATVSDFSIEDCEFSGMTYTFFRLQGTSNATTISNLNITNSIFHDMCAGYGFINVDAGSGIGKINNINISNCTLYNVATGGKMFIYSKNTNMESISIDHLTMYNCIGNGNYLIDFGSTSYGASTFTISNSLFTKSPDDNTKGIRSKVAPTVSNTYTCNDFYKTITGAESLNASSTDVFTAPETNDFTLQEKYSGYKIGDSRWY